MALTIKHLNGDASFLLSFDALLPGQAPFRILIDPWITGNSKIFHSKISLTTHKEPACVSTLLELPEPDLVIISQNKSDHCNEDTLRQLPPGNTKTIILAEPASARTIRSWKYFEKGKVRTIPRWEDPRATGHQAVVRITVPAVCLGQSEPGEITVAFIPQRRDISGLHAAVGITYRPPQAVTLPPYQTRRAVALTPPTSPRFHKSYTHLHHPMPPLSAQGHSTTNPGPLPQPKSPAYSALRSVQSVSSLTTTIRDSCYSTASLALFDRPLSVIYSPHGITYASLHSYTTSHLVAEAALPLTALLHCFDSVSNPWWLGGNIILGAPAGIETASRLGARAWISTHDGDKITKGFVTGFLRTRKWRPEDVVGAMSSAEVAWRKEKQTGNTSITVPSMPSSPISTTASMAEKVRIGTEIMSLKSGQEVVLTNGTTVTMERVGKDEIPEIPILKVPRPPAFVSITGRNTQCIPPPRPARPPSLELMSDSEKALNNDNSSTNTDIQTTSRANHTSQDSTGTGGSAKPAALTIIPTTPRSISDPHLPPRPSTHSSDHQQGIDLVPEVSEEEGQAPSPDSPLPTELLDENKNDNTNDESNNNNSHPTAPSTSPPTSVLLPELPAAFTERRWMTRRATVRGRGNNKTLSESDFASLEEIMLMRD